MAPAGSATRPTADRVRQALFDMLMHAEWGGRGAVEGAQVLDVFAGTGALGLEALSRGAARACFIENDAAALKALRTNVAACGAAERAEVLAADALRLPAVGQSSARHGRAAIRLATPPAGGGKPDGGATLVFLDPPYGRELVPRAIAHLLSVGHIAPHALIAAETGSDENWLPEAPLLAERCHGAARMLIFRPHLESPYDTCHLQDDT